MTTQGKVQLPELLWGYKGYLNIWKEGCEMELLIFFLRALALEARLALLQLSGEGHGRWEQRQPNVTVTQPQQGDTARFKQQAGELMHLQIKAEGIALRKLSSPSSDRGRSEMHLPDY